MDNADMSSFTPERVKFRKGSQLLPKSAWSKGPPANTATAPSTSPQSPAPSATAPSAPPAHSRRSSTFAQGVAFKDGVAVRNTATPTKSGSTVTFGSIDDALPTVKPEGIKSFGSVLALTSNVKAHPRTTSSSKGMPPSVAAATSATPTTSAASGSASTPKPPKFDVRSLFQPKQDGPSASSSSADVTSPAIRSVPLPQPSLGPEGQHPLHQPQPPQMGGPYSNFKPQQDGSNPGVPQSPSVPRQMPNGNVNGRPPPTTNGPPSAGMPQAMPSPRMGPPHGEQPQPVPHGAPGAPVPVPQWGGYYYPYGMPMDTNYYPHTPQWMPQHMTPQPHTPQAPPGSLPSMPMSPRGQQPTLHPPGTPTMAPTIPPNAHPPHPTPSSHMHTSSLSSISSTPSTPASSTAPGGGLSRLNSNTSSFTPKRVVIKSESRQDVDLERFKKQAPAVSSPIVPSSPARRPVSFRIETKEAKRKRITEEEAAGKRKEKEKDAEVNTKKAAEEKARRDEETRKSEEAEAQMKREEEEPWKKVEEERVRKEAEEEKERLRKEEEEEKERLALEAEEKARKEEEEERKFKEEEERSAKEAEEKAKATASAATKPEPSEEGEVSESLDAADEAAKEEAKDKVSDKGPLRIDTSLNSDGKRRPGRLDLSSTKTNAIPALLPSALATARIIEDIGSIEYPEGILSPKPELSMNAKQGKFRYDRDFLLQFMAVCKEKPDSLPPLDAIGLEPTDQSFAMPPCGGSQHGHNRRPSSTAMPPPSSNVSRQASVGLGISSFQKNVNPFTMGQFSTPKMSSKECFAASSRSTSVSGGPASLPFGRPAPMARSSSQGGPSSSGRTRSQRDGKRNKERPYASPSRQGNAFGSSLANSMSLEPVAPLANFEIAAGVTSAKSSRPPSRKSSVALGPVGAPEVTPQRKRPRYLPRSVPVDRKAESTPAGSTAGLDDEGAESTSGPSMSVEEANTRISKNVEEFFEIRDPREANVYFAILPEEHRHLLVDKLVSRAVEFKGDDAQLVAELLDQVHLKNLVSPASFEEGFKSVVEVIDDIAIDAPKALNLLVIMMKGAHLHEDEDRCARLAGNSMDGDKLVSLLFPSPRFMSTTMPLQDRDSCSDTYSCTVFGSPSPPCSKSSSPSMDDLGHEYSPNPPELPVVGSDSPTRQEPPSPTSTTSIPRDVPRVPRSEEASLIERPTDIVSVSAGTSVSAVSTYASLPRRDDEPEKEPITPQCDFLNISSQGPSPATPMSTSATRRFISRIADELFASHDIRPAARAFQELPARHHSRLIDVLVWSAVEGSDVDAQLVARLFAREACAVAPAAWEAGFAPIAETLCRVAEDEAGALSRFMILLRATGLQRDSERAARMLMRLAEGQ